MPMEIMHELMKDTSTVTGEKIISWARGVEAQRTQTVILDSLRDFDALRSRKMEQEGKTSCQNTRTDNEV